MVFTFVPPVCKDFTFSYWHSQAYLYISGFSSSVTYQWSKVKFRDDFLT